MKVAVAFALVACVAACYAAPAPRAVDWTAVGNKIGEIETGVRGAVQQIKTIANNDNEQVGSSISDQLDAAAVRALAILQQAQNAVADRSLTEAKAKELLGQLKDILAQVQTDLQDELAQLSAAAASQIRDIFYATYASAEEKAQQLYALLRAVLSTFAVDWTAVGNKIGEIETGVRGAVQQIKTIANNDNEQVGSSISDQLDAAAVRALAILQQAKDAVADRSLTEAKAKELLGQLKDILATVQSDLQDELAQLSAAAASQIRDIFYATYASAEEKAQQLYALLRAVLSTLAVDWTAVSSKIGEIESSVRSAVQQIKAIANNDNEQVGSSISAQLDAAAVRALAILQQASDAVSDRSLTEAKAKELLGQLKDILANVQSDLQDELAQLSASAASQIRDIFYATYAAAEEKAQQLYALLRQ